MPLKIRFGEFKDILNPQIRIHNYYTLFYKKSKAELNDKYNKNIYFELLACRFQNKKGNTTKCDIAFKSRGFLNIFPVCDLQKEQE